MTKLIWAGVSVLLVIIAVIQAHELMHGFGGALFGYGATIKVNFADPLPAPTATSGWFSFALSGTIYLLIITVAFIAAYKAWQNSYLLLIALAAGTVHQISFFVNLGQVIITGSVPRTDLTDPFHAAAILWYRGPVPEVTQVPMREIFLSSFWPTFLVVIALFVTLATWCILAGLLAEFAHKQLRLNLLPRATLARKRTRWTFSAAMWAVSMLVIFIGSAIVALAYQLCAGVIYQFTNLVWPASPDILLMLGVFLLLIPLVVLVMASAGWQLPLSRSYNSGC